MSLLESESELVKYCVLMAAKVYGGVNTKNPIEVGNAAIKFINNILPVYIFAYEKGKGEVVNGDLSDRKYYRYSYWEKSIELVLTLFYKKDVEDRSTTEDEAKLIYEIYSVDDKMINWVEFCMKNHLSLNSVKDLSILLTDYMPSFFL